MEKIDIMKYADAGVDVRAEEKAVKELLKVIKPSLDLRDKMRSESGKYSGYLKLGKHYLALSTDGVGTKTLVAEKLNKYDTIGIDLIAMVVNDLICDGFEPVALSDYIVVREPDENFMKEIGKGLMKGAEEANIAIISGETAVHPNMNQKFDLGATALGISENPISAKTEEGNIIIGLKSSGIHSNGISLARKLFENDERLLREVLKPTRIYVREILNLISNVHVKALAHITGGGFLKLKRIASGVRIDLPEIPHIFREIMERGVDFEEMCRTYNMGIGFVVVVEEKDLDTALDLLKDGRVIGKITKEKIVINDHLISL
ncbi:MAG TPA: phosphoribosylformylglycinamidine cyclo-ligase [Methanomicrobia archaeon]|nr:phosphoribosylformylglycinamidine cyclo-ligase [Methanomicrobia archaeon]